MYNKVPFQVQSSSALMSPPNAFQHNPESDRKYFLLRLRAATFAFELDMERRLQSAGRGLMPEEWVVYLENECRVILDEVNQYERYGASGRPGGETSESSSPSLAPGFSATHPHPIAYQPRPRTCIGYLQHTPDECIVCQSHWQAARARCVCSACNPFPLVNHCEYVNCPTHASESKRIKVIFHINPLCS